MPGKSLEPNWRTMANDMRGLLPTAGQSRTVREFVKAWLPHVERKAKEQDRGAAGFPPFVVGGGFDGAGEGTHEREDTFG